MQELSLEKKVGQLLVFGFPGLTIPTHIKKFITQHNLGGIIHFARNIVDSEQIRGLNAKLQELAKQRPSGAKLLIAVDQEGGSVARLTKGVSVSPGNMALGATANPELVEQVASAMGEELREVGFNLNLAPCVDVNNNRQNPVIGVRSYGSDPQMVAKLGQAAIKGFQRHLLAVAKHFPGHGDTHVDSHLSMPVIAHRWERLYSVELVPFRQAIEGGVAGILAAHVLFPALEDNPRLPATLSHNVLTRLLREQLGFQGLILTDCMEMDAIGKEYSMGEAAVLAVQAGCDLVLISHTPQLQKEAFEALVVAVETGEISMERIDQSLQRIEDARKHLAANEDLARRINPKSHQQLIEKVVENSLTVVQDNGNLPLRTRELLVIETKVSATSIAEDVLVGTGSFVQALKTAGFSVRAERIGLTCSKEERKKLVGLAKDQPLVIIVSQDAHRYEGQSELIKDVIQAAQEVIVVGARTPYELNTFPEVSTYIATYSNRPIIWNVLVKLLKGEISPRGKLPVSLD